MRIFIAIPIPESCLKTLEQTQQQLRTCGAEVRWTAIRSIHLTLKFLGEVDPEIIPSLVKSLRNISSRTQGFDIRLSGMGTFPNTRNPRIIWYGLQCESNALLSLQQTVEAACSKFGFAPEDRPFKPHLTLGRIKGRKNLRPLMDCIMTGSDVKCRFRTDHFNIYKSVLKPQGAVYTILETIALL